MIVATTQDARVSANHSIALDESNRYIYTTTGSFLYPVEVTLYVYSRTNVLVLVRRFDKVKAVTYNLL
jgi:hypothetical protein